MKSPIHYSREMLTHLDLSQLVAVSDLMGDMLHVSPHINEWSYFKPHDPHFFIGFDYRFSQSAEWTRFRRPLREGPKRNEDLSLVKPADGLLTLGEEYFEVVKPHKTVASRYEKAGLVVVFDEKTDEPVCKKFLAAEHTALITAWEKWKAAEPEIYAIIRKHLP